MVSWYACTQVLGQAVDSPAGSLLSDESICKAVQAAFMLGDPVTKPKEYGGECGHEGYDG